jgi:uncharacterized membrane protein
MVSPMKLRAFLFAFALTSLAGAVVAACSSPNASAGADCPAYDAPDGSPICASPPSYSMQVEGIIASRCLPCHGPGGVEYAAKPEDTYAHVKTAAIDMYSQVLDCVMPLPDAGQPTPEERQALLDWFACGAPNN